MLRWLFGLSHLLCKGFNATRDARIRFLVAQVEMLRRKLDRTRVTQRSVDHDSGS
jgi:hypothetical protein